MSSKYSVTTNLDLRGVYTTTIVDQGRVTVAIGASATESVLEALRLSVQGFSWVPR